MKALAIIDMQTEFEAAHKPALQTQIVNEIKKFRDNDDYIILVRYGGRLGDGLPDSYIGSPIIKNIREALVGYRKVIRVTKFMDDATNAILSEIEALPITTIALAGVNLCGCILDTLKHLTSYYKVYIQPTLVGCEDDCAFQSWQHYKLLNAYSYRKAS